MKKLDATKHMCEWLADDPYKHIISTIEGMLDTQVKGSKITDFEVTSSPDWLSGGIPSVEDESKMILVRAGVAFEFKLRVKTNDTDEALKGVYSWVGVHLNDVEKHQNKSWLDLNGTLKEFGSAGLLKMRIYIDKN